MESSITYDLEEGRGIEALLEKAKSLLNSNEHALFKEFLEARNKEKNKIKINKEVQTDPFSEPISNL